MLHHLLKPKGNKKNHFSQTVRILLEAVAIVFIWRGTWGLLDKYFFPNNPELSYFLSIVIGIVILLIDDWAIDEPRMK